MENRRVLLERMLKKIASHPILHKDAAFRVFLESENFSVDVRIEISGWGLLISRLIHSIDPFAHPS